MVKKLPFPRFRPRRLPVGGRPKRSRLRTLRDRLLLQENLNFLLTNRLPRVLVTRLMGRVSKIRNPHFTRFSIAAWRLFTDLDLSEAKQARFGSLQECFTRELKPGARPVEAGRDSMVSPCDGIVGECGPVEGMRVFQAKGFPYSLADLFGRAASAAPFARGTYVTLRLTSDMYHRFHSPDDATVRHVTYISGDTWNVNPIALRRVERLFCRNERAVIKLRLASGEPIALVAVAAILVAGIRLHFLDALLHLRWKGPNQIPCRQPVARGQELGWFEHGSTIIVFAPKGFKLSPGIGPGSRVRMGQRLFEKPSNFPGRHQPSTSP
jgi:phosphatidylserine decarboxylase